MTVASIPKTWGDAYTRVMMELVHVTSEVQLTTTDKHIRSLNSNNREWKAAYERCMQEADGEPEKWRPIPEFEGYEISDLGRVRSYRLQGPGCHRRQIPLIMKLSQHPQGDPIVSLRKNGRDISKTIHSLILMAFVGPPHGMEARHLDGNPKNSVLNNLTWGTHVENMEDAAKHGTHRGENNGRCRLTNAQISEIRTSVSPHVVIADKYGIALGYVSQIMTRRARRDV